MRRRYADGRFGQMHLRIAQPDLPAYRPLSGLMFDTWLGEMGRDRIAIAVDSPGFGCSDVAPAALSMSDYAAAMGDVLDSSALSDLDLREIDLLGYHTGGRIAVQLTLQRPQAVRHIVLIGAGMYSQDQQPTRSFP